MQCPSFSSKTIRLRAISHCDPFRKYKGPLLPTMKEFVRLGKLIGLSSFFETLFTQNKKKKTI